VYFSYDGRVGQLNHKPKTPRCVKLIGDQGEM
jgi:hypothetical protein